VVKRFLFAVALICAHTLTPPISNAFDTRCSSQPDYLLESPDIWESKNSQDLIYKVYWKLRDPEKCITGIGNSKAVLERYPFSESIQTNFNFERLNDSVIISSGIQVNQVSLESLSNKDIDKKGLDILGGIKVEVELIRDEPKGKNTYVLRGDYSLKNLWSDWFAKVKGTYSDACSSLLVNGQNEGTWNGLTGGSFIPTGMYSLKSVTAGKYIYQLVIPNANCIDWVYTGPVSKPSYGSLLGNSQVSVWKSLYDSFALKWIGDEYMHSNYPFWAGTSSEYFQEIKAENSYVRVFTSNCSPVGNYLKKCSFDKLTNLQTEQKFSRVGSDIVIDISITEKSLEQTYQKEGYLFFFHGSYSRFYSKGFEYSGRGWSTSCSTIGKTTTCRSTPPSAGGAVAANTDVAFQSTLTEFENPVLTAENKAKADLELKAKQDALSKHKQSCLQHNIEVEKLSERFNQLKKLYPSKVSSYFKDRNLDPNIFIDSSRNCSLFENDLTSFTFERTKAIWARDLTIWTQDLARDEERLVKLELAVKVDKKTTITCVKGKQTKKVTAVKPVCPAGYKKK